MNSIERKDKKKLLFYICGIIFPVLQFLIFYVFINFNSILLAFKSFYPGTEEYTVSLGNFFNNFSAIWKDVFFGVSVNGVNLGTAFLNSIKYYLVTIIVASTLNILFANYIYKKFFGHKFFQIILFIPKILSVSVLFLVYKIIMDTGYHDLMLKIFGMDVGYPMGGTVEINPKFTVMLIFAIWSGFGTAVLIYTSTMSGIPTEVVESAQLDGITPFKELIHITLPMIYPTFVTFMVVNIAGLFTNDMSLYLMYKYNTVYSGSDSTIGYYLFARSYMANNDGIYGLSEMSYLSAFGLLLSAIAIPLTFLVKWLLEKFGPSFE